MIINLAVIFRFMGYAPSGGLNIILFAFETDVK